MGALDACVIGRGIGWDFYGGGSVFQEERACGAAVMNVAVEPQGSVLQGGVAGAA